MEPSERFVYIPSIKPGSYLFQGNPITSEKTLKLLTEEGLNSLDNFVKELIETRKRVITSIYPTAYGLKRTIIIFDFKQRIMLSLNDLSRLSKQTKNANDVENLKGEPVYEVCEMRESFFQNISKIDFKEYVDSWLNSRSIATGGLSLDELKSL